MGDRGTSSEALFDHKAFTFFAENDLLAIPVDLFEHETEPDNPSVFGTYTFTGLYVYRVTTGEGFTYLGRIATDSTSGIFYLNGTYWIRGVFIDESVYAVNNKAVRSADLEDIEATINALIFEEQP